MPVASVGAKSRSRKRVAKIADAPPRSSPDGRARSAASTSAIEMLMARGLSPDAAADAIVLGLLR